VSASPHPGLKNPILLPALPASGRLSWSAGFGQSLREASRSIGASKVRSALTILALVVGIGGVLLVNAFGRAAGGILALQQTATQANLVSVDSTPPNVNGIQRGETDTLTEQDARVVATLPHVVAVSVGLMPHMGMKTQVVAGARNWSTVVLGVDPQSGMVQGATLTQGSFYTSRDEAAAATTAVVGGTVAENLFPDGSAVGQSVRIRNAEFTVVGVLRANSAGMLTGDPDDVVYVPFSTAQQRLLGKATTYSSMALKVDQAQNVPAVVAAATRAIEQDHHLPAGGPDDFSVGGFAQATAQMTQLAGLVRLLLTAITVVALAIGGFGIATVMLAAVARRTREIGIRMAVGAQRQDVLRQFLLEAAALSLIGGLLGVAAGFGLILVLVRQMPMLGGVGVPLLPGVDVVALAVGLSAAIGVAFGYVPARRAAYLDPVRALRQS
jgi:putative ABC transport system permease protein